MDAKFSDLLSKPMDDVKKPPALPAADYPGIIKSYEIDNKNKNQTVYCRYMVALTGPGEVNGEEIDASELEHIDLSKRTLRKDFYLSDDAQWRIVEFFKSCGIDVAGKTIEEGIPEAVGCHVRVEVQKYLNAQTNEIGNQIGKLTGVADAG